jgi:molybdopterin converting factor small subunit
MAMVKIPTPLRTYTQDKAEVTAAGTTIGEVLKNLERTFPGIGQRLFDEKGALRRYINIFHNDEDIRFLNNLATPVSDADRISIVPAIAGGCEC